MIKIKKAIACKNILRIGGGLVVVLLLAFTANCEPIDSLYVEDINLIKGEIVEVKVHSLTRVSLEDPGISDMLKADDKEITLIGKKEGQTPLFLWDEHGKRVLMVHVFSADLNRIKRRIENLLLAAGIEDVDVSIHEKERRILVSGDVAEHQKKHFDKLIGPFRQYIINIVDQEEKRDLIQIDAELIDIKETIIKKMGLNWTTDGSTYGFNLAFPETMPEIVGMTGGGVMDLFNIGDFDRSTKFNLDLHAAIKEGNATILSKPKLVVLNGESVDFNVGGEYPLTSSTTTDGTISTSTTFKSYGVGMTLAPVIIRNKIEIEVTLNISEPDADVEVDGATAFTSTTLSTKLYLNDGQLIVMAGLIKKNRSESISRIPYISKIPIIGKIFSYKEHPLDTDKEILLSLRPTILTKDEEKEGEEASSKEAHVDEESVIKITDEEMVPTDTPITGNMTEYVKGIQKKIAHAITYPEAAKVSGWEGTVKIGLNILKDGTLYYTMLKESSGSQIIDQDALKTARKVAPYNSFPIGSTDEEISVVIPISYTLN